MARNSFSLCPRDKSGDEKRTHRKSGNKQQHHLFFLFIFIKEELGKESMKT
jgi:hypothetical protein